MKSRFVGYLILYIWGFLTALDLFVGNWFMTVWAVSFTAFHFYNLLKRDEMEIGNVNKG